MLRDQAISRDRGGPWTRRGRLAGAPHALTVAGGTVYAAATRGLAASTDGGRPSPGWSATAPTRAAPERCDDRAAHSPRLATLGWNSEPAGQLVSVALGAWLVVGVFLDGWAHVNRPGLETFTPWHAVLYSGATARFGWQLLSRPPGARAWPSAGGCWPAPGCFAAGGAGDLAWHQLFGVETGLDALLSPTHLMLLVGGLLALTGPYRALTRRPAVAPAGEPRLREALPAVAALTLATALVAFFLLYLTPFVPPAAAEPLLSIPHGLPGHREAQSVSVAGLAGYLVTTALLVLPLLLLARRRLAPTGTATILLTTVTLLSAAVSEFAQPAAVPAGLGVDLIGARARHRPPPLRLVLTASAVPLLLWPLQLTGVAVTTGLRWPMELWLGIVVLSALAAGALALLAAPARPAPPSPAPAGASGTPAAT